MRIITLTCPSCGTIVAANELEAQRVLKCPGVSCAEVLRFKDLPAPEQEHVVDNLNQYRL